MENVDENKCIMVIENRHAALSSASTVGKAGRFEAC